VRDIKNGAVCAAWIAGLFLGAWLLWFFTGPSRDAGLMRQVNRILAGRGENFRVQESAPRRSRRPPLGTEFTLEPWTASRAEGPVGGTFLVFPLVSGGGALSCGALIDPQGRVERIIPLGTHAEQAFERLPRGIMDMYIRRIEGEGNL
jgi:hypothetical protein